jgi:hypothetical protein
MFDPPVNPTNMEVSFLGHVRVAVACPHAFRAHAIDGMMAGSSLAGNQ